MSSIWVGGLAALLFASDVTEISLDDRKPAVLIVGRSANFSGAETLTSLFRVADALLRVRTQLKIDWLEEAKVEDCLRDRPRAGILTCEVLSAVSLVPDAHYLIYVIGNGEGPESQVEVSWLSLDEIKDTLLQDLRELSSGVGDISRGPAYDQLTAGLEGALRTGAPRRATDRETLRSSLRAAVADDHGPDLGDRCLRRVTGALDLNTKPGDAQVRVDGERLAEAKGPFRVLGLSPGTHLVEGSRTGFLPRQEAIEMPADGDLELRLDLSRDHRGAWNAMAWSGVGVAAAGLAVSVYAVVETGDRQGSLHRDEGLVRLGRPSDTPSFESQVGDGPLIVGLGLALLTSGATLAVLGWLDPKADRPPWIEVALSVLAGGGAYGLTELVNLGF